MKKSKTIRIEVRYYVLLLIFIMGLLVIVGIMEDRYDSLNQCGSKGFKIKNKIVNIEDVFVDNNFCCVKYKEKVFDNKGNMLKVIKEERCVSVKVLP